MPRNFGLLNTFVLVCTSFSRAAEVVYLARSLTPREQPPQRGWGNASAKRIAKKRKQKQRAKKIGRRKR